MEKMTGDGSTREEVCPEKAGELSKSREEGGWDGFYPPRSDLSSYAYLVPGQELTLTRGRGSYFVLRWIKEETNG